MSFFKKFFNSPKSKEKEEVVNDVKNLPLDQIFVQKFIEKKGKFLYCTTLQEVTQNLNHIVKENYWEEISCNDYDLLKILKTLDITVTENFKSSSPVFIGCEHLIAENGSILFSSNQLKELKISEYSENFIVYATTSQIVNSNGESLTGIKSRYKGNIPNNISAIKNYNPCSESEDFMNYGNTNSKNLYLLLFEDL